MCPIFNVCGDTLWNSSDVYNLIRLRVYIYIYVYTQGVSGEIVNILGGGSMDYS